MDTWDDMDGDREGIEEVKRLFVLSENLHDHLRDAVEKLQNGSSSSNRGK